MKRHLQSICLSVLLGALTFPVVSQAEQLIWATKDNQVAAVMWTALKAAYQEDQTSEYPHHFISKIGPSSYLVEDDEHFLKCNAAIFGSSTLPLHVCRISEAQFEWKEASNSVQAVLYDALETLNQLEEAEGEDILVKSTAEGAYLVEGQRNRLLCESDSFGLTPVQSYRCTLEDLK